MTNYREILRLYYAGFSKRNIAESLGVSRNTVSTCISRAKDKGLTLPLEESMTNEKLEELLYYPTREGRDDKYLLPNLERYVEELKRPHVTKGLLWTEYVEECKSLGKKAYSISQFNALINDYSMKKNLSLRRDHNPGEVLELDWTGGAINLTNTLTGSLVPCHLFIAAFSYSSYFYAEAFIDEKIHNWTTAIAHSLSYFGGVPVIIRPDNCKTATIKADKYEPELNTATLEEAEYYKTVVLPARVRSPRDKNVVESRVGFVSRRIIAALRDQVFYDINELNNLIWEKMDELNNAPFTKKPGSRSELFFSMEKDKLLPLPPKPFELFERKKAKVAPDYHIEFDKCFYSVHYKNVGKIINVKASSSEVILQDDKGHEIARHPRLLFKGQKHTLAEHIPEKHRVMLGWSSDKFLSQARKIGPNAEAIIEIVLKSREFEVQTYRLCQGIIGLKHKVGSTNLEIACYRALQSGIKSYKGIKKLAEIVYAENIDAPQQTEKEECESSFFITHSCSRDK